MKTNYSAEISRTIKSIKKQSMELTIEKIQEYKKNYYIVYNDVTDEYELIDYSKCRWENSVIFKSDKKELVEARYNLIIKRREGTPKKMSKSPEKVSKFRCLG